MLELIVEGTPRSLAGDPRGKTEWRDAVRAAARAAIRDGERIDIVDVGVRICHYCFSWGNRAGDLDNIAKLILDGLEGVAFFNDSQVTEVVLRRTDLLRHGLTAIEGATPLLADRLDRALATGDGLGFVYICIGTAVDHGSAL